MSNAVHVILSSLPEHIKQSPTLAIQIFFEGIQSLFLEIVNFHHCMIL